MIEFRPDFLADRDKEQVYEAMVELCRRAIHELRW
jgi:hypothetical protein